MGVGGGFGGQRVRGECGTVTANGAIIIFLLQRFLPGVQQHPKSSALPEKLPSSEPRHRNSCCVSRPSPGGAFAHISRTKGRIHRARKFSVRFYRLSVLDQCATNFRFTGLDRRVRRQEEEASYYQRRLQRNVFIFGAAVTGRRLGIRNLSVGQRPHRGIRPANPEWKDLDGIAKRRPSRRSGTGPTKIGGNDIFAFEIVRRRDG